MEFTLNGEAVSAEPGEGTSLLELLREELGVRSVKDTRASRRRSGGSGASASSRRAHHSAATARPGS
jgi:hypothetical protein